MKSRKIVLLLIVMMFATAPAVMAQEHGEEAETAGGGGVPWGAIAAGYTIAIAAAFGALAQARAIAAAAEGVARNPGADGSIRLLLLIGLAFIESLVIYAWVISFIVSGK